MRRETLMKELLFPADCDLAIDRRHDAKAGRQSARRRSLAAKLLGTVAVIGSLSLSSSSYAGTACDAYVPNCDEAICDCGGCDSAPGSACDCGHTGASKRFQKNPLFKSLDFVAGGIEKVLGLDGCGTAGCGTAGCDSGGHSGCSCGCSGSSEMSYEVTPLAPNLHQHATPMQAAPMQVTPTPAPTMQSPMHSAPRLPAVPPLETAAPMETEPRRFEPREIQPRQVQPRAVTPRISEPQIVDPTPEPPVSTQPSQLRRMPEPEAPAETRVTPMPNTDIRSGSADPFGSDAFPEPPNPIPERDNDGGSIFDALDDALDNDDPFMDDEVRLRQPYQSVRPTALKRYQKVRRPSTQRDARQTSTRSQERTVVGSGLRPVSHNEPVELTPLGGSRRLAPYRASR